MAVYVIWSILVPAACGATFGVAPFITRRGLGYAIGFIGAGGNAGSSITQAAFFTSVSTRHKTRKCFFFVSFDMKHTSAAPTPGTLACGCQRLGRAFPVCVV